MKNKILNGLAVLVIAIIATVNLNIDFDSDTNKLPGIKFANVVALADNENGWGLLWEKHWDGCTTVGQINVTSSCGSVSAGTYMYSTSLLFQLSSCSGSYTVVAGGLGQKSYCYDGWSFCSEDECR